MSTLLETAASQYGLITREQALAAGFTSRMIDHRLRSGDWIRVANGIYRVAGAPVTWRQRLLAAVLVAGPGAVASHFSAAELWGLPGFQEGPIHVLRPGFRSRRAHIGTLHETNSLPARHVTVVEGIPVTTPERTVFDLAGIYLRRRRPKAAKAATNAVRLRLTTVGRLGATVAELARCGRPGSAGLRRIVAQLDDGEPITESELEDLLLAVAAAQGLPSPRRQVGLGGTGAPVGRVDFLFPPRLVVEADSRAHHGQWEDREADLLRDVRLRAAGFEVIRTTWRMLTDHPEAFAAAVTACLATTAA